LVVPPAPPGEIEISLVVPTFNESENVREFLTALRGVLESVAPGRYEIIVVDDDSPDRTWELAAELDFPEVRVVRRRGERGLASAVIRGWQAALGRVIGTINADFQHPPEIMDAMVRAAADADLVVASRHAEGGGFGDWHWFRQLASHFAHRAGLMVLPEVFRRLSDPLSGCYLVRRAAIEGEELHPLGYKTLIEITVRGRIERIRECPYVMRDRVRGQSKMGPRQTLQFFLHLLRLRKASR
jgi:dolichol-phosphate mannosyltransferase